MKICFINNLYGAEARGGAEKVIESLVSHLLDRGHEITVISGSAQKEIETVEQAGLKLVFLPSNYTNLINHSKVYKTFFHLFSFFNLVGAKRIGKIIKQEKFDLIWTHNLIGLNLLSFRFLGQAKKIHTFHDIQLLHPSGLLIYKKEALLNSLVSKFYQLLVRLVFPKELLGIFPSAWLKTLYAKYKLLPSNNIVLKNPIIFKSKLSNKSTADNNFNFLYLGQLEKHKGIELLIESFLALKNSATKLVIAGTGSLENELRARYKTEANIIFLGQVSSAENAFELADCLVVPSLCYENLPTVALEAAANNLPVIGSNLGGIFEAIGDERLLFEPNKENLAKALAWCLANQLDLKKIAALARQQIKIPTIEFYLEQVSKILEIRF